MKTEDLYLEYARVIKMCEGTEVKPRDCVKCDGLRIFDGHPKFTRSPSNYEFAVTILEDKPVFVGDKIFNIISDRFITVQSEDAFANISPVLSKVYSWKPPKQKRTFMLNGIELPCPVDWTESANGDIAVIDGEVFWFRNSIDRDLVRDTISRIFNDARNKQ